MRASSAEPRRSAKPKTLSTRTVRSRATVTTSFGRTGRLGASMRWPLTRTCPEAASTAAADRVRTTRACHNHLSMRWRSKLHVPSARLLGVRLELLLEGRELGERRIGIGRLVAPALAFALDVFRAQIRIAVGTITARRAIATRRAVTAGRTVGPGSAVGTIASLAAIGAVSTIAMVAALRAAVALAIVTRRLGRCRSGGRVGGGGRCVAKCGRDGGGDGRRVRCGLRPSLPRRAFAARLAGSRTVTVLVATPPRPPHFDELLLLGCGRRTRSDFGRWLGRRRVGAGRRFLRQVGEGEVGSVSDSQPGVRNRRYDLTWL